MAKKSTTPTSNAEPMTHQHVRMPNLRDQLARAARAEEPATVSTESETTTAEITTTAKKGR